MYGKSKDKKHIEKENNETQWNSKRSKTSGGESSGAGKKSKKSKKKVNYVTCHLNKLIKMCSKTVVCFSISKVSCKRRCMIFL